MHELVCDRRPAGSETRAIDVSKRLMDFSSHPPSNYFTLIEREAPMVEATEAEGKEALDAFAEAMVRIADEARDAGDAARCASRDACRVLRRGEGDARACLYRLGSASCWRGMTPYPLIQITGFSRATRRASPAFSATSTTASTLL